MKKVIRIIYGAGIITAEIWRRLYARVLVAPLLWSRSEGGRGLSVEKLPYIRGPGRIIFGRNVKISGHIGIAFSRHGRDPVLSIGDNTFIGHQCSFAMARAITIGPDCLLAGGTRIADNDGHPLDAEKRRRREPVDASDVRPVTLGANVWIGAGTRILKGVTIGDNAVVGAQSVVTRDIPANTLAAGSPARIIR